MFNLVRRVTQGHARLLAAFVATAVLATACSGSDSDEQTTPDSTEPSIVDDSVVDTDEVATNEPVDDAVEAGPVEPADETELVEEPADDSDGGVADEEGDLDTASGETGVAEPEAEEDMALNELAGLLTVVGVTDPDAALDCIVEEAEGEGIEVEQLLEGLSSGAMIAMFRCRPEEIREMLQSTFLDVDTSTLAATPDQLSCGFDTMVEWFPSVPLADANVAFGNDAPEELVDLIVDTCGMSREDTDIFLNDV